MAEVYAWCGITPQDYLSYTPAELTMMVAVRKQMAGYEEPAGPMTNPDMELVAKTITDTLRGAP